MLPAGSTCLETLMPMRDKDGAWRVMAYYIKTLDKQESEQAQAQQAQAQQGQAKPAPAQTQR
jgi:hypothetical protein